MDRHHHTGERGQILVVFSVALVAIIAMVGLILDGGSAFAQRRTEQNAADVAALAAANDLIVNQGSANWRATALAMTAQNGYSHGVNGVNVAVSCVNCPGMALDAAVDGVQVTVSITAPHANSFASIVGQSTWDVSTTATSKTGWPNTAHGPGPFIVSQKAFDPDTGLPTSCTGVADPCDLLHPVDDTPTEATEFTWTDFGYDHECHDVGNVNDDDLQDYLEGRADFQVTLDFGCYIAQHNAGIMNNIVEALHRLAPITFPVPIVDEAGNYVGWATFVLTDATSDGRQGFISGYFTTGAQNEKLDVIGAGFGTSTYGGNIKLQLVN